MTTHISLKVSVQNFIFIVQSVVLDFVRTKAGKSEGQLPCKLGGHPSFSLSIYIPYTTVFKQVVYLESLYNCKLDNSCWAGMLLPQILVARLHAKLLPPVSASLRPLPGEEMLGFEVRNVPVALSLARILVALSLSHVTKLEALVDLR